MSLYADNADYLVERADRDEAIVLLHGLGADHTQPLSTIRSPRFIGQAIVAPDARAHGGTSIVGTPEDFTFANLAKDLVQLLTRLEVNQKPLHLVGISMGAALAIAISIERRLDVRSLALIRPAFSCEVLPPNMRVMAEIGDLLEAHVAEEAALIFEQSASLREVESVSPLAAASLRSQFSAPLASERSERLRSIPRNAPYNRRSDPEDLTIPVLVVGTDRDPVHPIALARHLAATIPNAGLIEIPPRDNSPRESNAALQAAVEEHLGRWVDEEIL